VLLCIVVSFSVSVPFTSGSSLQLFGCRYIKLCYIVRFSSLYIGILAATPVPVATLAILPFQFPLHRDPRCNLSALSSSRSSAVSVPFTSGSSLQLQTGQITLNRIKGFSSLYIGILAATMDSKGPFTNPLAVSVPFTSGSSLQLTVPLRRKVPVSMFQFPLHRDPRCN